MIVPVPVVEGELAERPPGESEAPSAQPERARPKRYDWAELMRREFEIDVLRCVRCGWRRKRIALITDLSVARRILAHLGLPSEPPSVAPARPPPQPSFAF